MSIRSKRKDDHVKYALSLEDSENDFQAVQFIHNSLPQLNWDDVSTTSHYFGRDFKYPIYINAMTGGSEKTKAINRKLAMIAKTFDLAISVGSQHVALDEPHLEDTFKIIRETYPEAFIIGNVSANATVDQAHRAIAMLDANALGIHINVAQELTMDEGDRDFGHWLDNIKAIVQAVSVPVVVKEVGFGMSYQTIQTLHDAGVKRVDVSGKGGTNFIAIENARSVKKRYDYLANWGISPVASLLMSDPLKDDVERLASGGVKTPLDVIKLLRLGAHGVGMSKLFLEAVQDETTMIQTIEDFLEDLKKVMILVGAGDMRTLRNVPIVVREDMVNLYGKAI